jgi:enediyne biosynthesis protein E4
LLDLFLTGGGSFHGETVRGRPNRLYKNLGGWKFQDVTAAAGLDAPLFYSHGCAVADYDRDGWPDLLVTGYGRVALYHNVPDGKGGRRFADVTRAARLEGPHFWSTSAAFGDLDGDGYPDLYLCQYVTWSFRNHPSCGGYTDEHDRDICSPKQFDARPHALYRNRGDGTFADVSKEAGLRVPRKAADHAALAGLDEAVRRRLETADRERDYGKGLGVVFADVDGDGRPDVYVANDTSGNFLYLNRSKPGRLLLEEVGFPLGVSVDGTGKPNGSMGVDAADYDGSGRASLLVTNYQNELPALYRNQPGGVLAFDYASEKAGISGIGRDYVGFGIGFLDADGDGWEDVVLVNGHVVRHPPRVGVKQPPVLLHNEGSARPGRFRVATAQGGGYFRTTHQARGVAIGDLDNDGRPDLVISHINEPVAVLRNVSGPGAHWLGVRLADPQHRDLVGARVVLEAGGRKLTRYVKGGGSYLSSGDRRLLFGLGNGAAVERLTVVWPWGQEQHVSGPAVDQYLRMVPGGN